MPMVAQQRLTRTRALEYVRHRVVAHGESDEHYAVADAGGSTEEIRRYALFGALGNGNAAKFKGFAEACMAEYDFT